MTPEKKSKTDTIKQRTICVYVPTEDMADRWKDIAKDRKTSLSKFVMELVEDTLAREEDENFENRAELIKRKTELEEQVRDLSKDLRRFKTLADKQEKELREYRSKPFLDENFEGVRSFSKSLVNLLKDKKTVKYEDLHNFLDIVPGSDESMAIQEQLKQLEKYGLIEYTDRFIRWSE